jgi:hypothetical protein
LICQAPRDVCERCEKCVTVFLKQKIWILIFEEMLLIKNEKFSSKNCFLYFFPDFQKSKKSMKFQLNFISWCSLVRGLLLAFVLMTLAHIASMRRVSGFGVTEECAIRLDQ